LVARTSTGSRQFCSFAAVFDFHFVFLKDNENHRFSKKAKCATPCRGVDCNFFQLYQEIFGDLPDKMRVESQP